MSKEFSKNNSHVIVVVFKEDARPHVFGSQAIIFRTFSASALGCKPVDLWRTLKVEGTIETPTCYIYYLPIIRGGRNL